MDDCRIYVFFSFLAKLKPGFGGGGEGANFWHLVIKEKATVNIVFNLARNLDWNIVF